MSESRRARQMRMTRLGTQAAVRRAVALGRDPSDSVHFGIRARVARMGWRVEEYSPESVVSYAMGALERP